MRGTPTAPQGQLLGSTVRVRLHGERQCEEAPHFSGEDGMVGRVVSDTSTAGAPAHPFLVIFDYPLLCRLPNRTDARFSLTVRHYAEHEITPI